MQLWRIVRFLLITGVNSGILRLDLSDIFEPKAGDTRAKNWCKFSSKFLNLCVDEQYPNNMTSTHNRRNLLENLRKCIAHVSPALATILLIFSNCYHYGFNLIIAIIKIRFTAVAKASPNGTVIGNNTFVFDHNINSWRV